MPSKIPQPLHDRILVSIDKPETKSAGGIIIPSTAQENQHRGQVIATGPKVGKNSLNGIYPRVGDIIQYGKYSGYEIEHEGKEYLMIKEADIQLILNKK